MRTLPILFSAPMVRALIAGRKTQTRRLLNPQPPTEQEFPGSSFGLSPSVADGVKLYSELEYPRLAKHPNDWDLVGSVGVARDAGFPMRYRMRYAVGDRLWVRESWQVRGLAWGKSATDAAAIAGSAAWHYRATDNGAWKDYWGPWRPSIHMPRKASRLTLTVTAVCVQRLQEITAADAEAEGVFAHVAEHSIEKVFRSERGPSARDYFGELWDSLHGDGAWDANPWVVAYSFTVAQRNVDEMAGGSDVLERASAS